ncbi:MAG TPA: siphovirus Gp157 family protein, partial [Nitrosopumilaceae archaeon]|nr:siphovirus Gp157 family protein [Nitrosopumilaceae archaeon]
MITQSKDLSLWQLTNEHQKLLNELYDHETGEVNEIIQAKLDELDPTIEKKCISITQWIKKLESEKRELDYLTNEIEQRKRSYDKEVKKYQNYLEFNMKKQGIREIKCPYFTIRIKKNPYSTDIINDEL